MTATLGKIIADFNTTLNLKVAIGATSATIDSATDDDGVALPTGTYFLTIDGDSVSSKEYIKCTLTSTALTSIQSVSRQGALTSGFARTHRKGATVTITDFAIIKKMLDLLDGTTTFNASVPLGYDGTATISTLNQFATKAYVDGIAIAGSPDATTSTKGITTMSVAPASAATPIAVGDNDPRVPTQGENDALVGTSGTPSTSNKYVTNDDTATAATADKVARRLAGGNVTLVTETTGNSTTNGASTAFVQQEITANSGTVIYPNVPNVGVLPIVYFTHSMNVDSDLGWTPTGTPTNNGNWYSITGATNTRTTIPLAGRANAFASNLQWNSGIDFKFSYLHTTSTLSAGTTPAGGGDFWYWHGVTTAATVTSTVADITDVSRRAGFSHYNGRIYAVTANGTNVQTTDIQADAANTKRQFMIDFTATSIKYYINGVLVATHTTYPPNDANDIYMNFGGYDGDGGSKCAFGMSNDIIFSETII